MIIDFHTHIFPDKIAAPTVAALAQSSGIMPHSSGTEAGLLSAMERAGVDIAVNLPVLTRTKQFESITRFASELNKKSYTGGRIISFAGVHPDMEDAVGAVALIKELGFLGIKIHPDYQNTFIDDDRYVRLLGAAKQAGLITVTHAGVDGAYVGQPVRCTPRRVMNLLDKLGGYDRLVLAHLGGNEMFDEVYDILCGENVYFDTAYILHVTDRETVGRIVTKHGEDKVLFATDSPWRDIAEEVDMIHSLSLGGECEEKIFSSNAKKLLGLD